MRGGRTSIEQLATVRRDLAVRRRQVAQRLQPVQYLARALFDAFDVGIDDHLGGQRLLVGIGHTRELGDLAAQRSGVQALGVALDQHVQRAAHEDLDEGSDLGARFVANAAVRRDRGGDRHATAAAHELGDVGDAADVGVAVFLGKTEALAEVLAHFVAVEHLDMSLPVAQGLFERPRERALAGAR